MAEIIPAQPVPSTVTSQNEASHQQTVNTLQQQWLGAMNQIGIAVITASVNQVLSPGARAVSFRETTQEDTAGEQVRIKAGQTTPPITAPGPVT